MAGQPGQLVGKGVMKSIGLTAVMGVAGTDVEQCVTREQGGLFRMGEQADVAQGMTWCVQTLQLDRLAHLDHITRLHATVHPADPAACLVVRNYGGSGGGDHSCVTTGMVAVLLSIQQLCDLPASHFGYRKAFFVVQRVDGEGFTRF